MKCKRKLEILRLLEGVLDPSEPLTLRSLGINLKEAIELGDEQLVSIGDNGKGADIDRYCCVKLLDNAKIFLTRNPPKPSVWGIFGKGLLSFLCELLKIGFGVMLGWYLKMKLG